MVRVGGLFGRPMSRYCHWCPSWDSSYHQEVLPENELDRVTEEKGLRRLITSSGHPLPVQLSLHLRYVLVAFS